MKFGLGFSAILVSGLIILLDSTVSAVDAFVNYWFVHFLIAFVFFIVGAGLHYIIVDFFKATDGNWLAGLFLALPFYISREIAQ